MAFDFLNFEQNPAPVEQGRLSTIIEPQAATPAPAPQADPSVLGELNRRISSDPNMLRALLFASAAMMQPKNPGDNTLSILGRSAAMGAGVYDAAQTRQREYDAKQAEEARKQQTHELAQRQGTTAAQLGEQTLDAKVKNARALADKAALDVVKAQREGKVEEVLQKYKLNLAEVQGNFDPDVLAQNFYAQLMKPVYDNLTEQEKATYYQKHGNYLDRMPRDPLVSASEQSKKERISAFKTIMAKDPQHAGKSPEEIDALATIAATDPNGLQVLHAKQAASAAQLDPRAKDFVLQFQSSIAGKKFKDQNELRREFDSAVQRSGLMGGIAPNSPEAIAAWSAITQEQGAAQTAKGGRLKLSDVDKQLGSGSPATSSGPPTTTPPQVASVAPQTSPTKLSLAQDIAKYEQMLASPQGSPRQRFDWQLELNMMKDQLAKMK